MFASRYGHDPAILDCNSGLDLKTHFPDYAGPLTETILLGNLAVWAEGKKIDWDAKKLRARNAPEVAHIIHPPYRKGWSV